MTQLISIIAGLLNFTSGAGYLKQMLKGESTPNPATWLIWFVVTIINAATYFLVVNKNFWVSLIYIVSALVIATIFLTSLLKGKFTSLSKTDALSLALAVMVGLLWVVTGNPIIANICLQVIMVISFYPTLNGLLKKTAKERPAPWLIASGSYVLQIINILLNPITLWALVSPLVNLIGQGAIGFLAYYQNKRRTL